MYLNVNNPVNYQLQGFGQNGVRTISTDQLYIQGEYYRVLVAEEDSYVTAVSVLGDDLTAEFVYAGTTIYGLFTEVSVSSGSLTAYIAGPTDIEDVWAYINAYGQTNAATIEAADCAKDAIAPLLDKYYAKASLVMVPSLYKTSIVYSERPLTTDGQLAFTRSNDTATRVGPDGYIEKVRTNLLTYSQGFDNAAWVKSSAGSASNPVVTANDGTAPDGTTTADKVVFVATDSTGISELAQSSTKNGTYAGSIYIKAFAAGDVGKIIGFRFASGTYALITLTADWQRFSISQTGTLSTFDLTLRPSQGTSTGTVSVYIWGAQLETGDIATNYIPTTASAVSVGPVANLPRLNYPINSDGSVGCPSLLLEPQRTNTLLLSEQLDVLATWSRGGVSVTANNAVSPDGYTNADLITADGTTTQHYLLQGQSGAARTYSIFLKMGTQRYVQILTSGSAAPVANYDLQNGVANMVGSSSTASIENYGNGWYRCILSTTDAAAASFYLLFASSITTGRFEANNSSGTIWAYGAQAEVGAYATSYIPTLGASVTRGADACSKTGISSLIGQTEGTLFADFVYSAKAGNNRFSISDGSSANWIFIGTPEDGSTNASRFYIKTNNTVHVDGGGSSYFTFGQRYKLALAYKSGNWAVYGNGTLLYSGTDSIAPVSSPLSVFNFFSATGGVCDAAESMNQALLFKTRLTNQELQDLTTL